MKIAGLNTLNRWYVEMNARLARGHIDAEILNSVPVVNQMYVEKAVIAFDGPEHGYRPFMLVEGYLTALKPTEEMVYGITEVFWNDKETISLQYRYDFSDEQIKDLIDKKGLYQEGFSAPQDLVDKEWLLPGMADFFIVAPEDFESPPILFATLKDPTSNVVNELSSGYELVEFFDDKTVQKVSELQAESEAEYVVADFGTDINTDVIDFALSESVVDLDTALTSETDMEDIFAVDESLVSSEVVDESEIAGEARSFSAMMGEARKRSAAREAAMRAKVQALQVDSIQTIHDENQIMASVEKTVTTPVEPDAEFDDVVLEASGGSKAYQADLFDDFSDLSLNSKTEEKRNEEDLRRSAREAMSEEVITDMDNVLDDSLEM